MVVRGWDYRIGQDGPKCSAASSVPVDVCTVIWRAAGRLQGSTRVRRAAVMDATYCGPNSHFVEVLCGDGETTAEALEAAFAQAEPD